MKKFFYACAAILCIVMTYHFGATSAQGQGAEQVRSVGGNWFATQSGIWEYVQNAGWKTPAQASFQDPPVPASQVLYYNGYSVVSTSGEAFSENGSGWTSFGIIPGGPTPTIKTSFGQLKARYR